MSVLIIIMIAPVVIIAAVLQKHIARGLLVGAVKGCFLLLAAASLLSTAPPAWSQNPTDYRMWQRGYDRSTVYRSVTPKLQLPTAVPTPRMRRSRQSRHCPRAAGAGPGLSRLFAVVQPGMVELLPFQVQFF